ncbi:hypothetical protein AOXY_G11979 [Acipenser oxyrinchus oxyrinchus]|uniref:Tc1-like transposase DDE domain-containing protein n=1 Tax=Acipenser oxyrinchus oxyrinchus TaxID=40147 RepID=A0AAD8G7K3_ACIOX|nr:hypothetical protein AOXY_G11979 [Acipenser oxyrinchus oxyrinchus]
MEQAGEGGQLVDLVVDVDMNRGVVVVFDTGDSQPEMDRRPPSRGRGQLVTEQQETAIVDMVIQNNVIRLKNIQQRIIQDNDVFTNIHHGSLATIDHVLKRNAIRMKQVYRVPFERNSARVKEAGFQYVQRIMELDASLTHHKYVYVDKAGFNLTKKRRRGRNVIGQHATVQVPGQHGGNVTICAAISRNGVVARNAVLGPYNTAQVLLFLESLKSESWRGWN